ncbi:vacuolar-type H+-ATPase subunit I/STV1 [Streptomyces calvus]
MRRKEVRDEGEVEAALDELYALPPSDFVARREERAAAARTAGRAEDARRIRAARRPTLAAWAANLLRRSRPDEAERFLELGRALREAYATLDPEGLKELSAQRRRIVSELSRQAAALAREAGHPLSDAVQRDVETTLRAVLADPEAAEVWAGGRLESTLTPPSEFAATAPGPARKEPRAPARAPSAPPRGKDELAQRRAERQQRLALAQEAAREAEERLRDRRTEQERADDDLEAARERHREAQEQVTAVEDRLRQARAELERAERERTEAQERGRAAAGARARAEREAREAARQAERAAKAAR